MKKRIAFFDLDGTITTKDTLLENIRYQKGSLKFLLGFLLSSPFILAYKLKIISNQAAKEKVLQYFFKGISQTQFQSDCNAFAKNVLPKLIRPAAIEEIKRLKDLQAEIVIVSASASNWLQHWIESNQLSLLATRMEVKDNRVTGKIEGKNCHGEEKVRRIKESYDLQQYDEIYCYGDSSGDRPMLALGQFQYFKPFR